MTMRGVGHEHHAQLIRWHHEHVPLNEQATRLNVAVQSIKNARTAMFKAGVITKLPRPLPQAKRCRGCGEKKPLDAFDANPNGRYGRRARCKACEVPQKQERRHTYTRPSRAYDRLLRADDHDVQPCPVVFDPVVCAFCGVRYSSHCRCVNCRICLGPGHAEGDGIMVRGERFCDVVCARRHMGRAA